VELSFKKIFHFWNFFDFNSFFTTLISIFVFGEFRTTCLKTIILMSIEKDMDIALIISREYEKEKRVWFTNERNLLKKSMEWELNSSTKRDIKKKLIWRKKISQHQERKNKHEEKPTDTTAKPSFLLERSRAEAAKVLSNSLKQKRKEKAGKWNVPLPKVRGLSEAEVFRPITTGKKRGKQWKRLITKPTFVGDSFTRKPPKYERFIRPMGLRFKRAHVTHPELKTTFYLDILGVKKNPSSPLFTQLGVLSKGTILEVNVSDLGLVTQSGKVVWGKYAQITNNPENDGCVNALLLV